MRNVDQDLLNRIQRFVEEQCDKCGYGPSVRTVAAEFNVSTGCAQKYMARLERDGRLKRGKRGYESNALAMSEREMQSVAILGEIPCGPLTECEECIEGYIRLPESLTGQGKFFLLNAKGNSMVNAGIDDGDLVLIRQQETADVGDIVVALVENESTLKRLGYNEREQRYYLHPENDAMEDIYVEQLMVQGVAVKVLKELS